MVDLEQRKRSSEVPESQQQKLANKRWKGLSRLASPIVMVLAAMLILRIGTRKCSEFFLVGKNLNIAG